MNSESDLFVVAVMAIIIKDRKMLMMQRSLEKKAAPGVWEVLSGRLQHGEQPHAGLLREIKEESGLEVELQEEPFDAYKTKYIDRPMLVLLYRAKALTDQVILSEEHSDYYWGSIQDFEEKSSLKRLVHSVKKLSQFID